MQARVAAAIVCALGAAVAASPQGGTESRRITVVGRVVDAVSGAAVPNARVTAPVGAVDPYLALTDSTGRFSLIATSSLRDLQVRKSSYAPEQVDLPQDLSKPLNIPLSKSASIAGRVVDTAGDPLSGVRVSIGRNGQSFATLYTDDRGAYRIGGLGAGAYGVSVQDLQPPRREIYFPGADAADAERLTLRSGEDRIAVDFVLAAAQSPRPSAPLSSGTGMIRGRVVDSFGLPIARARLTLTSLTRASLELERIQTLGLDPSLRPEAFRQMPVLEQRTGWSDSSGRFEFRDLRDADFTIGAAKSGYMQLPNLIASIRVKLTAGEVRDGIELCLETWASVEGRISDERGDPIEGATIQILRTDFQNGRRTLKPWALVGPGNTAARIGTDERGYYRLFGLPSGRYVISATLKEAPGPEGVAYAPTFYPGTVDPAAAHAVNLTAGANVMNIDMTLTPVRTARVAGRALARDGTPRAGNLALVPSHGEPANATLTSVAPDGSFEFANVTPGKYMVQTGGSVYSLSRIEEDFGAVPVTVDGSDVEGVIVQAMPGYSIKGIISFNAPATVARPPVEAITVTAVPDDPVLAPTALATSKVNPADRSFTLANLAASRRLIASNVPLGWEMETVRVNGSNIGDAPMQLPADTLNSVEIVLTNQVGSIAGQVRDVNSTAPPSQMTVVAFSADPQRWYPRSVYVRTGATGGNGQFTIVDLKEGRYLVAIEPRMSPNDGRLRDPEYLADISGRASTVVVARDTTATLTFEVSLR